jgi:hypothetical protein
MRVVRELAALRMLGEVGCLDLHAAAFAVRPGRPAGRAETPGRPRCVSALGSGRASLLANDRVFVETNPDPLASGVPTPGLDPTRHARAFPEPAVERPGGTALLHAAEIRGGGGRGSATPRSTFSSAGSSRRFRRKPALRPIAAIVFPRSPRRSQLVAHPVAPSSVVRACARTSTAPPGFRSIPPSRRSSRRPQRRQPSAQVDSARSLDFACRLGPDTYRDGADAWLRALPLDSMT